MIDPTIQSVATNTVTNQATTVTKAAAEQVNPADVDRLRSLIAGGTQQNVVNQVPATHQVQSINTDSGATRLGDSILHGIVNFNSGYHGQMSEIGDRLTKISNTDPAHFGSNFGDIMSLQMEIAQWSMSVMGVDNASKAGTNTVNQLSRGS
jgi:hypothetical protein